MDLKVIVVLIASVIVLAIIASLFVYANSPDRESGSKEAENKAHGA
jgi:hypothetical protein